MEGGRKGPTHHPPAHPTPQTRSCFHSFYSQARGLVGYATAGGSPLRTVSVTWQGEKWVSTRGKESAVLQLLWEIASHPRCTALPSFMLSHIPVFGLGGRVQYSKR